MDCLLSIELPDLTWNERLELLEEVDRQVVGGPLEINSIFLNLN